MHIKAIFTATALVLVAGLGSASAEDQFNTIADLSPQALTAGEMREVRGAGSLVIRHGNEDQLFFPAEIPDGASAHMCGATLGCFIDMAKPVPVQV